MKVLKWLDKHFELLIGGIAVIVMTTAIFVDVFMRSFMGMGIVWAQELARTCTIVIGAMGMSYGAGFDKHIKVDILETIVPKSKNILHAFGDVMTVIFCAFIAYYGLQKLQDIWALGTLTPVMQIPQAYIYMFMEVGLILGVIRTIEKNIVRYVIGKKGDEEE